MKMTRHAFRLQMIGLVVALWAAFALRLAYARQVNLIGDEYISILAIRSTVQRGVPLMPSGLFYGPKALLHTYVGAFASLAFGSSDFALRFPSIATGVLAVCLVYRAGRSWFSPLAGIWAAVAMVLLPSAVEWGGRVRMYSLFQLLSLGSVLYLTRGYLRGGGRWIRVGGVLLMLAAVFSHTLALVVLGASLAGIAIVVLFSAEARRRLLPAAAPEVLAWCALVAAVVVLNPAGGVWGVQVRLSEVAQGSLSREALAERLACLLAFTHEFVTWPLWPLTLLYVAGLANLILRGIRQAQLPGDDVALSLYVLGVCAWGATSILTRFHADKYLFGILPFYLLLVGREAQLLVRTVIASLDRVPTRHGALATGVMGSLLIIALMAPSALRSIGLAGPDMGAAFIYVRETMDVADLVATGEPAPSFLLLGRADYYLLQNGPEAWDGKSVLTGSPLIDTPGKLEALLASGPTVWAVLQRPTWDRHFDEGFRGYVSTRMRLVFDREGTLVFVSP